MDRYTIDGIDNRSEDLKAEWIDVVDRTVGYRGVVSVGVASTGHAHYAIGWESLWTPIQTDEDLALAIRWVAQNEFPITWSSPEPSDMPDYRWSLEWAQGVFRSAAERMLDDEDDAHLYSGNGTWIKLALERVSEASIFAIA